MISQYTMLEKFKRRRSHVWVLVSSQVLSIFVHFSSNNFLTTITCIWQHVVCNVLYKDGKLESIYDFLDESQERGVLCVQHSDSVARHSKVLLYKMKFRPKSTQVSKICSPRRVLPSYGRCRSLTQGWISLSLYKVVVDISIPIWKTNLLLSKTT